MPHIHELIDWTVVAYVVHKNKVLFVFHKELQKWLPLGGHIELDEDPDQALVREVKEESGIEEIEVLAPRITIEKAPERKFLYTPAYVDIHTINERHRHPFRTEYQVLRKGSFAASRTELIIQSGA